LYRLEHMYTTYYNNKNQRFQRQNPRPTNAVIKEGLTQAVLGRTILWMCHSDQKKEYYKKK